MSDETPGPRSSGKLVPRSRAHPAVRLEVTPVSPRAGKRSSGKLVPQGRAHPAVVLGPVNRVSPVVLELTFTLTVGAGAEDMTAKIVRLIDTLNEFEKVLGGAGVTHAAGHPAAGPGTFVVVVVPNESAGAQDRLSQLATVVATAVREFTGVGGVRGRVIRQAEPDRPLFETAV